MTVASLVGCGASRTVEPREVPVTRASAPDARPSLELAVWLERCTKRIDVARRSMLAIEPAFATLEVTVSRAVWNPSVRLELRLSERVGERYYEASVAHGSNPCIDFDSHRPERIHLTWTDAGGEAQLARIRRLNRDEAWIGANGVAAAAADAFRRAFELAIEGCVTDAQLVELGPVGPEVSCLDTVDRCPDHPDQVDNYEDPYDGCPPLAPVPADAGLPPAD